MLICPKMAKRSSLFTVPRHILQHLRLTGWLTFRRREATTTAMFAVYSPIPCRGIICWTSHSFYNSERGEKLGHGVVHECSPYPVGDPINVVHQAPYAELQCSHNQHLVLESWPAHCSLGEAIQSYRHYVDIVDRTFQAKNIRKHTKCLTNKQQNCALQQ